MAHKLYRLLDSLYNKPHLVTESALYPIVDYIRDRTLNPQFSAVVPTAKTTPEPPATVGAIGEIKIDGVLTYRPVEGMCGDVSGVSYQGILEQAAELIEMGCETIVMTHSSPGGEAAHTFTTAEDLRAMCDDAGVKLITYIDEMSCSAALAIGVVADEVFIHPSAQTGSIGCVCAILDKSKALENAGLKPIYIASTPGKTPFNADGSFADSFLEDLQKSVTDLGNQFAAHVSKHTGIPMDDITAMDAKSFNAVDAVAAGLANQIMDHKQFANYLAGLKDA